MAKVLIVDDHAALAKALLASGKLPTIDVTAKERNSVFDFIGSAKAFMDNLGVKEKFRYDPRNHFRYALSRTPHSKPTTNGITPVNDLEGMSRQVCRAMVRDIVKSDVNRKYRGGMSRRARRGIAHTVAGNYWRGIAQESKATGNPLGFLYQKFAAQTAKARAAKPQMNQPVIKTRETGISK